MKNPESEIDYAKFHALCLMLLDLETLYILVSVIDKNKNVFLKTFMV